METVSLQDLIKDVASAVRDLATGTTSTNGVALNDFTDSRYSTLVVSTADNQWKGTQVIFEEPAATAAGLNAPGPHVVTLFTGVSGQFLVSPNLRTAGVVPAGLNYFMVRAGGRGNPYSAYVAAIRYALDELNVSVDVFDNSLVTADQVYDYTLPTSVGGVYKVDFAKDGYTTLRVLPRDWTMLPGRKLHLTNTNLYVAFGWTLNLYGVLASPLPATLDGTVYGPRSAIVDLATEYLQRSSTRPADNQRAALKQQERLRYNRMSSRPNLRMVLP